MSLDRNVTRLLWLLLPLAITCIGTKVAPAADGFMARVTAAQGQIKLGTEVLATVPRGTRLWVFEVKDSQWSKVKIPGQETKGWMYRTQIEKIQRSEADQARLKQAYAQSFEGVV